MREKGQTKFLRGLQGFIDTIKTTEIRLSIADERLTASDTDRYIWGLILTACLWYDLHPAMKDTRWVSPWLNAAANLSDIRVFHDSLAGFSNIFLRHIEQGSWPTKRSFKGNEELCGALIAPILSVFAVERENPLEQFRLCHQMAQFPLRLTLTGDYSLYNNLYREWVDLDDSMRNEPVKYGLRSYFKKYFSDWNDVQPFFECFQPRHGSGATADVIHKGIASKYRKLGWDPRVQLLLNCTGWSDAFMGPSFDRTSKLIMVPKSMVKKRLIAPEPTTCQYLQQGVFQVLNAYIKRNKDLGKRICLEDATLNADMAQEGSIGGYYSTIDLSNASDSVNWESFKAWAFGTWLYKLVFLTRTDYCAVPGIGSVHLAKASSMGSATNFPLECFVFCAIVEYGIEAQGGTVSESNYRVYGDDIVVETIYYDSVISALVHFGFKVNNRKSYHGSGPHIYRESCGGEYLDGADVTPMRISRKLSGFLRVDDDRCWQSHVTDLVNESYIRGFKTLRMLLIRLLLNQPVKLRPLFGGSGDGHIYTTSPTNFHLLTYYDCDTQSWIVYHGIVKEPCDNAEDEPVRYYETLRLIRGRKRLLFPEDRVSV